MLNPSPLLENVRKFIESDHFTRFVMILIVANAITLAMETSPSVMAAAGPALFLFDSIVLAVFVIEILLKLAVYRWRFFLSGWNVFDLAIVSIALVPASGPLAVLRALRILRVLRLVSLMPQMRRVVEALLHSLPGMASIGMLMSVVFFVSAVVATKLFGALHPGYFGTLGDSLFTLFAIMTLEGWAEIAREVQTTHPKAYLFFVPFIVISVFAVLNLFIAVLTNSMQEMQKVELQAEEAIASRQSSLLLTELVSLRNEVSSLRAALEARQARYDQEACHEASGAPAEPRPSNRPADFAVRGD
ncbi:MAG: ion transporter [Alphaproteobacteria bacterium]|nr:ion transporter [Alphaproteobacteria bacterium]